MFKFDRDSHKYTMDGVIVPSVTEVISDVGLYDLSMVPKSILDNACSKGTFVHKLTELYDMGTLNIAKVKDNYLGYLKAWETFKNEKNVRVCDVELMVFSNKFKYAGTMDRVAVIDDRICILDIKTGAPSKAHAVQTSAYALAYKEMHGEKVKDRFCVYLSEKGEYKLTHQKDMFDESIFLSALSIYNFKRRR
jgi:hypothetical protein